MVSKSFDDFLPLSYLHYVKNFTITGTLDILQENDDDMYEDTVWPLAEGLAYDRLNSRLQEWLKAMPNLVSFSYVSSIMYSIILMSNIWSSYYLQPDLPKLST